MPVRVLDERGAGASVTPVVDVAELAGLCGRALELAGLAHCALGVALLDDARMADYNRRYRGKEGPTNVLAFPAAAPPGAPAAFRADLGDVLISVDTARREAEAQNAPLMRRLAELALHGLLHLAGYDHERSEAEALVMWEQEQRLAARLFAGTGRGRKNMPQLSINIDHVATLRQARGGAEPDPVLAAGICELAGARGIVAHLREDRRHVQDRDARLLRETVKTHFNLEMAATRELLAFALDLRPDMVTLVPEKRRELTTEGGLDAAGLRRKLGPAVRALAGAGIEVSLFVDPEAGQIEAAAALGASHVELHTGRYAEADSAAAREREFALLRRAAELAREAGLLVKAGHGLDYRNVGPVAGIPGIGDLSIGHAVISRAAFVGLDAAVREMLAAIREGAAGAER